MDIVELCVPARGFSTPSQISNGQPASFRRSRFGLTRRLSRCGQHGFSIVEVMMSLVLLAVGTALALPSYHEMVQKRQITHGAEQILAFVNTAQGEAAKRNEPVLISFSRTGDTDWCIGAGTNDCKCGTTPASCQIESVPWLIDDAVVGGTLRVKSMSGAGVDSFCFDPIRGIAGTFNGTCDLGGGEPMMLELRSNAEDYRLNLTVSRTGQVVLCRKDESDKIPGYPLCPPVAVAQEGSV